MRPQAPGIPFPQVLGEPVPVSAPPRLPLGTSGNVGEQYGIQGRLEWEPGDNQEKELLDCLRAGSLWRISVFGAVVLRILYGTSSRGQFLDIRCPAVLNIPGQATISARPFDSEHSATVVCRCTLTPATAGALSQVRKVIDAGGGAVAFDSDAVRFVALVASTLTISGIAVAVPALSAVPLVVGALLNTGSGYQEFEA